ncbi:hypothetical protein [Croceicoccus mobilis]|uniref:Uncharacterized protein n=1 Tax=Croceicoccus mobilis TaxID=1703339 RepID=A0A917DR54_9SPHN|nr:hypothetical protein [Croceicoccus mobilis]GGD58742.1 hypothetical protein GCM10010990_04980 [Croceicoccus mobilis]
MTDNLIPFPSAIERADAQFLRTGQTDLTRAQDEATTLFALASGVAADGIKIRTRIEALRVLVDRLAETRPDAVEDFVTLDGLGLRVSLAAMPELLKAMLRPSEWADRTNSNPR